MKAKEPVSTRRCFHAGDDPRTNGRTLAELRTLAATARSAGPFSSDRRTTMPNCDDDPLANTCAKRRWRVRVKLSGSDEWQTREIEADEASPWTDGVLYFWNWVGTKKSRRLSLYAFAPGTWQSLEAMA